VEVSAMPFSDPLLPALGSSGLGGDVATQVQRGRSFLRARWRQAALDASVARPPESAIDGSTVQELARQGTTTLLLDGGGPRPAPTGLVSSVPPVAEIRLGPSRSVNAVVPQTGLEDLITSPQAAEDPVLGAHLVLGDLAEIWLEQPSVTRGVALVLPEQDPIPSSFFGPFARQVASAPWLEPLKATKLVDVTNHPSAMPRLASWHGPTFSGEYVQSVKRERKHIAAYRSAAGSSLLPAQMQTALLLAENDSFTGAERLGREFVDAVHNAIGAQFSQVHADVSQPVTLTSANSVSSIPVHIVNDSRTAFRVTVQLVSPRLSFAGGDIRTVRLTGTDSTLSFGVTPNTTGRFPVQVLIRTPSGRKLSSALLIVRSTAYNRVALLITIGALVVLVALWARRTISTRRTQRNASPVEPERQHTAP
jgi:hypothetical protein